MRITHSRCNGCCRSYCCREPADCGDSTGSPGRDETAIERGGTGKHSRCRGVVLAAVEKKRGGARGAGSAAVGRREGDFAQWSRIEVGGLRGRQTFTRNNIGKKTQIS